MQWYYAISGQRQGPVTQEEFDQLIRDGVIRPETLVWKQGMMTWLPYSQVAPPPPPIPSPSESSIVPAEDDTAVCAMSGRRLPKRDMIHYEGRWISSEYREAFFQSLLKPSGLVYAGFWIRFLAKIIDGIALNVIGFLLNMTGIGFSGPAIDLSSFDDLPVFFTQFGQAMLFQLVLAFLYSWFFLARFQATPGKMVFGLKIVRADGSALKTGRIIGRFFAERLSALILYIGYILAAFDEQKRALHDQICDTRVIKTR